MAPYTLSLLVAAVVSLIILLLAVSVVWQIWNGSINLAYLLSEPVDKGDDGLAKASLSRFQFLVFTFVIAGLYLVLSIEAGTLIEVPNGALVLLGISGGSYLVSKASSAKSAKDANDAKAARNPRAPDPPPHELG
jgi:hypothetical protein